MSMENVPDGCGHRSCSRDDAVLRIANRVRDSTTPVRAIPIRRTLLSRNHYVITAISTNKNIAECTKYDLRQWADCQATRPIAGTERMRILLRRSGQPRTERSSINAPASTRAKRKRALTLFVADAVCIMLAVALALSSVSAAFATSAPTNPSTPTVTVPNVANMTLADAKAELESTGLVFKLGEGSSNKATAKVSGTDPWAGTAVPKGSTVLVYAQDAEPKIVEMQLGYHTGRTLTYSDGHTEPEIAWADPNATSYDPAWIESRGGTLQLACRVKWNTTGSFVVSTSNEGIAATDIRWGTSDERIATVDAAGLVQATGLSNDPVTITCTLINQTYIPSNISAGQTIHATIDVNLAGQRGEYPEEVVVVDANGKALGQGDVILSNDDGTAYTQLFARIRYTDGLGNISYKVTSPSCGPNCVAGVHSHVAASEVSGLTWSIGDSTTSATIVNIEPATGIVTPVPGVAGTAQAVCTVLGGKDGPVKGTTDVIIEGLTDAPPSDTLTVQVVYDEDRSYVASTGTYNAQTLARTSASGALYQAAYTQVKTSGLWRTVSGEGVKLRDVLADVGVSDLSQVQYIIKAANDGVTNALTSGTILFNRASYYFPNFDQVDSRGNHNLNGGIMAEPMIALRSYWAEQSTERNFTDMNADNRFELLLGNNGTDTDLAAAEHSTYKMHTITVVLKGGPPIPPEEEEHPGPGQGGDGSGGDAGAGDGAGAGAGDGAGDAQGTGTNPDGTAAGAGMDQAKAAASEGGAASEDAASAGSPDAEEDADATPLPDTSREQRVYQYMNRYQNDLDYDFQNPLSPYFLPACCGVALAGSGAARERLRRQMGVSTILSRAQAGLAARFPALARPFRKAAAPVGASVRKAGAAVRALFRKKA